MDASRGSRKGVFLGGMGLLLALLLVPEVLADGATVLSPRFALIGVELPAEGAIDWFAFTLASFSLLQVIPKEILGEHYEQLFQRSAGKRGASQVVDQTHPLPPGPVGRVTPSRVYLCAD